MVRFMRHPCPLLAAADRSRVTILRARLMRRIDHWRRLVDELPPARGRRPRPPPREGIRLGDLLVARDEEPIDDRHLRGMDRGLAGEADVRGSRAPRVSRPAASRKSRKGIVGGSTPVAAAAEQAGRAREGEHVGQRAVPRSGCGGRRAHSRGPRSPTSSPAVRSVAWATRRMFSGSPQGFPSRDGTRLTESPRRVRPALRGSKARGR